MSVFKVACLKRFYLSHFTCFQSFLQQRAMSSFARLVARKQA